MESKQMLFSNKQIKKLIIPLIIEQILITTVGIADTMMISFAGEAAISGAALVDMVNNLVITILAALATGGSVIVSQYLGSKDEKRANKSASQLITISLAASLSLTVICLLFHKGILNLLFGSVESAVMDSAVTYFVITTLSFPFLGIYNVSAALFRSMSKTNVTMYVSLFMNVINVVGNAIGIFVFKAGVAGVAIPTLISRAVATMLIAYLASNKNNLVSIKVKEIFSYNHNLVKRILLIAIPSSIENGLFHFGRVLVTSIVALLGTTQIAANSIANSVSMISSIPVNALNLAIITVVGQCVGANDYNQAKYYIKKLMKFSYIAAGSIGLTVILLLPFILSFYSLSEETIRYAYILITMHNVFAFLLHPTSFILGNGIRAAGDVKFTMIVGIGSMLAFRVGSALLFGIALKSGIIGIWISMATDWTARSICFCIRYRSGKWEKYRAV